MNPFELLQHDSAFFVAADINTVRVGQHPNADVTAARILEPGELHLKYTCTVYWIGYFHVKIFKDICC